MEVTSLIHGRNVAETIRKISKLLFGLVPHGIHGDSEQDDSQKNIIELFQTPDRSLAAAVLDVILEDLPHVYIDLVGLKGVGQSLLELLVYSGLCSSKGQARKDIEGGGIYVNFNREANFQRVVTVADLLGDRHLLLRKGKKNYVVVTVK